jgi:hypothetical protein
MADDEVAVQQAGDLPWGGAVDRLPQGDDCLARLAVQL